MIGKIKESDAKELIKYFSKLVELDPERVERVEDVRKIKVKDEISWIKKRIESEDRKEMFVRCVREGKEVVALGEVERMKRYIERHVAEIRFGVIQGHEKECNEMIKELISVSAENGINVLIYFHLESQKRGIEIMKELGFSVVGKIKNYYFREGKYTDRVYLTKII